MSDKMAAEWDEAFAQPGKKIPVGRLVVCDDCNVDYSDRLDRGGLLFQSKAICPLCALGWWRLIALYGEQKYVQGECPPDKTFADWGREMRGPDAGIRVTTVQNIDPA
jgi:hypothetical protein